MTELKFIERFLRANWTYAQEKFAEREQLTVTEKSGATDLLTEVDLTLQKRAVEEIGTLFPDDGILAEEGEHAQLPKDPNARCWVIDSIDGTNNFVRGVFPIYAISLAFAEKGVPVAAGVLLPGVDMIMLAQRGEGAFCNGDRMRVSDVKHAAEARVDVDFSSIGDRQTLLAKAAELITGAGQPRSHGSAVSSIAQIATGSVDAYIHMNLSPWDYAAAWLIVEEAGGMATRIDGRSLPLFEGKEALLLSNGAIHDELLDLIEP